MSKSTFYCWIRALPATSRVPKYVVDERGKEDLDLEPPTSDQPRFELCHSGRPPKRRSVESGENTLSFLIIAESG